MGAPFTTTDARGSTVELWNGGRPEDVIDMLQGDEFKQFKRIVWPVDMRMKARVPYEFILYFLVMIGIVIVLAIALRTQVPRMMSTMIIVAFSAGWTAFYFRRLPRKVQHDVKYIELMRSFDRCPACLYKLTGQAAEPDGCVVCPECGSAWRGR